MESITAYFVFGVKGIRNSIQVRVRGHLLVKRRIEDCDLRHIREVNVARADAAQVVRVMQRCNVNIVADPFDDIIINKNGGAERFAAVNHAMADGIDLPFVRENAVVLAQKDGKDVLDRRRVVENLARNFYFIAVRPKIGQYRTAHSDPVDDSFRARLTCFDFDQLVLDRGTAAVDNKNIHRLLRLGSKVGERQAECFP